ncbi:MAG TPA: M15 family metallopeptidase [Patescibacteria group bacterium]|jgi:D-alanyl-D-alanine dipeptidase|nr:M15 family metallopeptidase [Patescibacteria group bacterium]
MTLVRYETIEIKESHEPLVNLKKFDFFLEPVYFNLGLSADSEMYLRESVAKKLSAIQNQLQGFKFKIWDGFRPREVQNNIYQKYWRGLKSVHPGWSNEQLAAQVGLFVTQGDIEDRIPPHSSGGAVDLTLANIDGSELDMGTKFDHFGPEAASLFYESHGSNDKIRDNRRKLREAMAVNDFRVDVEEWWHYDFGNQFWAIQLNKPFAIYGEAVLGKA